MGSFWTQITLDQNKFSETHFPYFSKYFSWEGNDVKADLCICVYIKNNFALDLWFFLYFFPAANRIRRHFLPR